MAKHPAQHKALDGTLQTYLHKSQSHMTVSTCTVPSTKDRSFLACG